MSDWRERTRPEIQLTSPDGNEFIALWQKNRKPKEKNLGIFNPPNVNGSIVQDLGTKGYTYPMTLFFTGIDHDLTAQSFMDALSESGTWTVIHPIDGVLDLQPISFNPDINPVDNGSYTVIETNWIEPIIPEELKSTAELETGIIRQKSLTNAQAVSQFNITQASASERISAIQAIQKSITSFQKRMQSLTNRFSEFAAAINNIVDQITSTLTDTILDAVALASQIQYLFQLPGLIQSDINSKIDTYKKIISDVLTLSPTGTKPANKNTILVQELVLSSISTAMADTVITAEYKTRPEIIGVINNIIELFNSITTGLDANMTLFSSVDFDLQYYSESESYQYSMSLLARIIKYLLTLGYNLKIEKRIIITKQKTPIRIVIEEYGELGEDDILLDLFIESNNLMGNELLLINPGREVVVYV